ncbi:MAG TPA: TatD family hydrolase [Polyangiales bacterium]|jgi:TatD DNase family protein|nr:TatD family hydrolase [Polyangiales bacterium]
MGLADVHAHLTSPRLRDETAGIVERARAAGVTTIISNGLHPTDNARVRELAKAHPIVKPAFGFYPVDTVLAEMRAAGVEYPREDVECSAEEGIAFVREHASEAIAVGEIGLDGYWVPEAFWAKQEDVFRQLVQIAMEADKPIIVHTRKREKRALELLRELGATRVNWHCFGGKVKLAREIAEHGHWLSIPANARRSESFTRMLQTLPRERVLLETDCPYLAPEPGGSSEPAHVAGTAAYAAELWGVSLAEATARVSDNFFQLFRIAP